MIKKYWYNK